MSAPEDGLPLFVVYKSPSDYPGKYVVRVQVATAEGVKVYPDVTAVADTLEGARSVIPKWCVCLGRNPKDESQILEVWV